MPVILDSPHLYDLARFERPAGIVLTSTQRTSPALRYSVPERFEGRWVKVVLSMRAELPSGRQRGFAHVTAVTDGRVSAAIELEARGRAVHWSAVGLHDARSGRTTGRSVRVQLSNYARVQATKPGRHTLRFRVKTFDGFRLQRVQIKPGSGLLVTRQPPQALTAMATVQPPQPVAGTSFDVRLALTNTGVLPAAHIKLRALAQAGLRPREPLPTVPDIPAGGTTDVALRVDAVAAGSQLLQVLTESSVGQDLRELRVPVAPAPAAAGGSLPAAAGSIPWTPLGAALAAGAFATAAMRRVSRRRA